MAQDRLRERSIDILEHQLAVDHRVQRRSALIDLGVCAALFGAAFGAGPAVRRVTQRTRRR